MNSLAQVYCRIVVGWSVALFCSVSFAQDELETQEPVALAAEEDRSEWPYLASIAVPAVSETASAESSTTLADFFVTPDIFGHARADLGDVRLFNADGDSLQYAVRVLSGRNVRETIVTSEFNRSEPEDGVHELALELLIDDVEHNEVLVQTSGMNFRRQVTVSGSDDGKDWKPLVSGALIRFTGNSQTLINDSFVYPGSRHRYVRVQVTPDPQAVTLEGEPDAFTFETVSVMRQMLEPGEKVRNAAIVSDREPTRHAGGPGSRWIFDFGASIPCDRLEIEIQDDEFARDVTLEMETANMLGQPEFVSVYLEEDAVWQRRPGDESGPMVLSFSEILAKRLRLTVVDYRNKPLTLTGVTGLAAARQIVLERPQKSDLPLQIYFGNQNAENTNYDFARNLPESLPQVPVRATVSAAEPNPEFTPPPKPWTERLPWLIYVVLASVSVVLAAVIVNLSRAAIANHDSESATVATL